MRKLVERLEWDPPEGVWTAYGERNSYTDDDAPQGRVRPRGGEEPRLEPRLGHRLQQRPLLADRRRGREDVVAVDADQGPVELLYRDLKRRATSRSSAHDEPRRPVARLGWRGLERKAMPDRGKPDLVLALALVHHVAISANVPVKEFVDWLASLGSALVIEFPRARTRW